MLGRLKYLYLLGGFFFIMKKIFLVLFFLLFSIFALGFSSTQCNNRLDDDSDGKIDKEDPDCSSPLDDDEGCTIDEKEDGSTPNDGYDTATKGGSVDCPILTLKGTIPYPNDVDFFELKGGRLNKGIFHDKYDLFITPKDTYTDFDFLYVFNNGFSTGKFQFYFSGVKSSTRPPKNLVSGDRGYIIVNRLLTFSNNRDYEINFIKKGKSRRLKQIVWLNFVNGFSMANLGPEYANFSAQQFKTDVISYIKSRFESIGYSSDYIEFRNTIPFSPFVMKFTTITFADRAGINPIHPDIQEEIEFPDSPRTYMLSCPIDPLNPTLNYSQYKAEHTDKWNYYYEGQGLVCVKDIALKLNSYSTSYERLVEETAKGGLQTLGLLLGLGYTKDSQPYDLPNYNDVMHFSEWQSVVPEGGYSFSSSAVSTLVFNGQNFSPLTVKQYPAEILNTLLRIE